jgi:hypothetical protein
MLRNRLITAAFAMAVAGALISCAGKDATSPPPPPPTEATLSIGANLSGTMVATVIVDVTGPGIPTMLEFNIPITAGVASGTITIPVGSSRNFSMHAYDAGGVETHSGSVTTNIQTGTNPTLSIVLTPLVGNVPITATLGSFIVTVTPSSPTISLGGTDTQQLTVSIVNSQGSPVTPAPGAVTWATHTISVAVVDANGLVGATGVGTTTITAVYQGVAGTATVTVTP